MINNIGKQRDEIKEGWKLPVTLTCCQAIYRMTQYIRAWKRKIIPIVYVKSDALCIGNNFHGRSLNFSWRAQNLLGYTLAYVYSSSSLFSSSLSFLFAIYLSPSTNNSFIFPLPILTFFDKGSIFMSWHQPPKLFCI